MSTVCPMAEAGTMMAVTEARRVTTLQRTTAMADRLDNNNVLVAIRRIEEYISDAKSNRERAKERGEHVLLVLDGSIRASEKRLAELKEVFRKLDEGD